MSKNILETLLGSNLRVKILKYIFRNAPASFSVKELAEHVQGDYQMVRKEVQKLVEIGLIKLIKHA
jgi:predicted transcriptional regulator